MNKIEENTKIMVDFGLTRSQAKSYLVLLELGTASVKEVAKFSNIARPDTYRALIDLQELGLVEKIVVSPTKYKPLPIADTVNLLMLRRNKETLELDKRGNALIELLREKSLSSEHSEESQLTLILGGDAITTKIQKIFEHSKEQICVLCPNKKFLQCKQSISENIQKTLRSSKIIFLLITEDSAGVHKAKEILDMKKSTSFQIKHLQSPPPVCFAIFDRKEVILCMNTPELEYSQSSAIWSNNPSLVELGLSYFEHLWHQA